MLILFTVYYYIREGDNNDDCYYIAYDYMYCLSGLSYVNIYTFVESEQINSLYWQTDSLDLYNLKEITLIKYTYIKLTKPASSVTHQPTN